MWILRKSEREEEEESKQDGFEAAESDAALRLRRQSRHSHNSFFGLVFRRRRRRRREGGQGIPLPGERASDQEKESHGDEMSPPQLVLGALAYRDVLKGGPQVP